MKLLRHFPLRIAIQSIFISIFVILMGVIISLSTYEYAKSIDFFSKKLMTGTVKEVMYQLRTELKPAELSINITQSLMKNNIVDPQQMIEYTYFIAKNLPHYIHKNPIRITAWGDAEGNSVETSLETDGTYSTAIVRPNASPPVAVRLYRDPTGKIIKRKVIPSGYDPRTRPWYLAAKEAQHIIWTKMYLSYPYKNLTVATALPIYNKQKDLLGVFEIELKLLGLSDFLSNTKTTPNSQIVVLNDKNQLIAYGGMKKDFVNKSELAKIKVLEDSGYRWVVDSLRLFDKTHQEYFRYESDGSSYLAHYKTIPKIAYTGLKIGIIIPENDFTASLKKASALILIVSITILLLGALLTRFFSRLISSSLILLVKDTKRIKDFHLDDQQKIHSHISEIAYLSEAMESMKISLRAFKKFVPTDLVRHLIQSGEGAGIGGVSKNITTFFTDIRGFTSISESMEPEQLMHHLCDYFEELSKIISNEKGTIDKYIGDSIMAFWGAPLDDEKHCYHACEAALQCKARLATLNAMWEKQNKPPLITAIGIHTGKAIIGNIGSSTRLNYTAIGDTINFTSRLELQSKKYDSIIIVSEDVVNTVKDQFTFRFIEKAEIRGKAGAYNIYELVDKTPS